ncbi:IQ motif, EF-hand binding site [Plasmopara halstedii]|uniref:IQ motif, EF-hand binding site n=1 Tax=Plasmopara halstedii TaxID=4781 RepID=A0A0P1AAU0_PLAHL|nr:IQ motif, EF-hand binding site [Plasmopara halstedii]CEG37458.1 IQ motif, EF-hand binding site [Plasmopara halstedii]|eukprot:XP_024573827.1 IQ motif, EF-hand binding site [Plasmopara halstedii]
MDEVILNETQTDSAVQGDGMDELAQTSAIKAAEMEFSSDCASTDTHPTLSIPLGSIIELTCDHICASSAESENLKAFASLDKQRKRKLNISGWLERSDGSCQRSHVSALIREDAEHCDNQLCLQVQTSNDKVVTLRFELSPDIAIDPHPQLVVKFRSKTSRKISIRVTLKYLLQKFRVGIAIQCNLQLLDENEHSCGHMVATLRGGLLADLDNNHQMWAPVSLQAQPCILTVKVIDTQTVESDDQGLPCSANIWSSRTGKLCGQTISGLIWKNNAVFTENGVAQAVSLQVMDAATDVVFVGIYRPSRHERNELLGLGRIYVHMPDSIPDDGSCETQSTEQLLRLYIESLGVKRECGSMAVLINRFYETKDSDKDPFVSLAATALARIAYPTESAEMKCRFDIDILELQGLSFSIFKSDDIFLRLCIAQSGWNTELSSGKLGNDGNVRIGERASAIVRWTTKDRSFPMLEISVYARNRSQYNKRSLTSRASLAPHLQSKLKQTFKREQDLIVPIAPVLIGTGSFNLCSFFFQQNISVPANLTLEMEQDILKDYSKTVSVVTRLRASTSLDKDLKSIEISTVPQFIKGDVCIRLLQGSGEIFRKADLMSRYYVLISCGVEKVQSSCCPVDTDRTVTWNQQLALSITGADSPVVYLSLYQRTIDRISFSVNDNVSNHDQLVGDVTLPLFPSILEDKHLLQLTIPFGMPSMGKNCNQSDIRHYQKRGLLSLEMQFISTDLSNPAALEYQDTYELVIHQVRGNFQRVPGLTRYLIFNISILIDRGDASEELAIGTSDAMPILPSTYNELNLVFDLSNPEIADTLASESNMVIIVRIRDKLGDKYGCVHFPLRRDWKQSLNHRKRLTWFPICEESSTADVNLTENSVSMCIQTRQQSNRKAQYSARGKFHINISEAIQTSECEKSNSMKQRSDGGASILISSSLTNESTNVIRYRTRQATDQNSNRHWHWEKEWFVFDHNIDVSACQDLQVSMQIGVTRHTILDGKLLLAPTIKDATLKRFDLWLPLSDNSRTDVTCIVAHLHVVIVYVPTIVGTLNIELSENFTCSEAERLLHIETVFYKCMLGKTSSSTVIEERDSPESSTTKLVRLLIDTRLDDTAEIPELVIQRIGLTKLLGEICLDITSMDLLAISELCCLVPSTNNRPKQFVWCKFTDKSDRTKTTGVTKLRLWFDPARNLISSEKTNTVETIESVVVADAFTIWKKLFYLLDQNNNGYIDRNEFVNVFLDHFEEIADTVDGQKLLQLLFADKNKQSNLIAPTEEQIKSLFNAMDSNSDNEIEWLEYLQFLQQRQQLNCEKEKEIDIIMAPDALGKTLNQKLELNSDERHSTRHSSESSQKTDPLQKDKTIGCVSAVGYPTFTRSKKTSLCKKRLHEFQFSNQEQSRLLKQISSLETILAIERKRYAEVTTEYQALVRSYQRLHLKHQSELILKHTKTKIMKQTIEHQQQQLEARETLRRNRNEASIMLQSTVRSRLEMKRYQGIKFQRATAAITIQCMIRRVNARRQLQELYNRDRLAKQRICAVLKMQKFIRVQMVLRERASFQEAKILSATILQKNARRLLASTKWWSQKTAVLRLQCWFRQRLAVQHLIMVRDATSVVGMIMLKWILRWQYIHFRKNVRKLQSWWRRVYKKRFIESSTKAALYIQKAWKRKRARRRSECEEENLALIEAAICIQAVWRGRQQRLLFSLVRSEAKTWFDDESAIDALVYNLVAIVEANVV